MWTERNIQISKKRFSWNPDLTWIKKKENKTKTKTKKLENVPFPRARVELGGRVSSYQVTQPLTYIFEPLTVAQIKGLLQTLFMYARCQHPQPLVTRRGHVYIFWCLAKIHTLTEQLLSFEVVWDLTFFDLWPLIRRSDEEVSVDFFDVWPRLIHWQCYFYHFTLLRFDLFWPLIPQP